MRNGRTNRMLRKDLASLLNRYERGERREALSDLESLIQKYRVGSQEDAELLERYHRLWTRAADPEYQLPAYVDYDSVAPLLQRSKNALADGDVSAAMSSAWSFLQYTSAGTIAFQKALSQLVEVATASRNRHIARCAAEMFLAHFHFVEAAVKCEATPVGFMVASEDQIWSDRPRLLGYTIPLESALIWAARDQSACWIQIMELSIRTMRPSYRPDELREAASRLVEHYEALGNSAMKERMSRYLRGLS